MSSSCICMRDERPLKCTVHPYSSSRLPDHETPKAKQKQPFECNICEKEFTTKSALIDHKKLTHLTETTFTCEICSKSFKKQSTLKFHTETHGKSFTCHLCFKRFAYKHNLKTHIQCHLEEKQYICDLCPNKKSFNLAGNLVRHKKSVHSDSTKHFPCEVCKKIFKCRLNLQEHKRRLHRETPRPIRYLCEFCKKGFYSKHDYEDHIRTHTKERPFSCPLCFRGFATNSTLRRHISVVHAQERCFRCYFCPDRTFSASSSLRNHVTSRHTFEQPFKCRICSKRFTVNFQLQRHLLTHGQGLSTIKIWKCNFCSDDSSKTFTSNRQLEGHIIQHHTKDFPYRCSKCGIKQFGVNSTFIRHMKNVHRVYKQSMN